MTENGQPERAANDSAALLEDISSKAPDGIIIPPVKIRKAIETTAGFVARSGPGLEARLRESGSKTAPWVLPEDSYHQYYLWRLGEIRAGNANVISAGREGEAVQNGQTGVSGRGREERKGPEKPEDFHFSARMPNISAQDLEVVKLTALFVAKNGRSFMTQLSQREAGNFQFDFLRPQHSLYQFFTHLKEQYEDLIQAETVDGGRPHKRRITELEANVSNRFRILERAKKRAEWVKHQEAQKVAKDEADEKERIAYQQIDWHDFVVVETVVFTEEDDKRNLPAPTTLNDLQSASLEQKAAMTIRPDRRIEEAMPTFSIDEDYYAQQQQQQQSQPVPLRQPHLPSTPYAPTPPRATPPAATAYQPPLTAAEEEATRVAEVRADRERARAAQEAARAANSAAPLKIRSDYVPRAQQVRQKQAQAANTSICPNCGQAIPNDEIQNHMRIEMLDPQWRDQHRIAQQRSSTTNLSTQDVANNLKRLASQRTDVFDPVTGMPVLSEEEKERRKRKELGAYDGVSGMPNPAALGAMGGALGLQQQQAGGAGPPGVALDGEGRPLDVQEQLRQIHQKYKQG